MKKQKTQSKIIVALTAVVILLVAVSATLTFAYFTANSAAQSSQMTFGTLNLGGNGLTLTDGDEIHHVTSQNSPITPVVPGCKFNLAGSITVTTNIDTLVRTKMIVTVKQYRDENGVPFTAEAGTNDNATKNYVTGHADVPAYELKGTVGAYYLETSTSLASGAASKAQTIYNLINTAMGSNMNTAYTLGSWIDCATDGYRYYNKVVNGAGSEITILNFSAASITLAAAEFGNDWQGAMVEVSFQTEAIQAQHLKDDNAANIVISMSEASSGVKAITAVKVGDAATVNATITDANDNIANVIANIATAEAWGFNLETGLANPPAQQNQNP